MFCVKSADSKLVIRAKNLIRIKCPDRTKVQKLEVLLKSKFSITILANDGRLWTCNVRDGNVFCVQACSFNNCEVCQAIKEGRYSKNG